MDLENRRFVFVITFSTCNFKLHLYQVVIFYVNTFLLFIGKMLWRDHGYTFPVLHILINFHEDKIIYFNADVLYLNSIIKLKALTRLNQNEPFMLMEKACYTISNIFIEGVVNSNKANWMGLKRTSLSILSIVLEQCRFVFERYWLRTFVLCMYVWNYLSVRQPFHTFV